MEIVGVRRAIRRYWALVGTRYYSSGSRLALSGTSGCLLLCIAAIMANGWYECGEVLAHEMEDLAKENEVLSKKVERLENKLGNLNKQADKLETMFAAMQLRDSRSSSYGEGRLVNPGFFGNHGVRKACLGVLHQEGAELLGTWFLHEFSLQTWLGSESCEI